MSAGPRLCVQCGAPLAADQYWCLECGERAGEVDPALERLKTAARDSWPAAAAAPAIAAPAAGPRPAGPRLPPPRAWALMLAAFLGFGVLLGSAAGSPTPSARTAGMRIFVPTGAAKASQTPTEAAGGGSSEPPAAEEQPTPAPVASTHTAKPAAASTSEPAQTESGAPESSEPGSGAATKLPPIHHVFLIVLSDEPYATAFGPASTARYLTGTLEHQGELLVRYHAVAHEELADGIALVSGQGPTPQTEANCPTYTDVAPAAPAAQGQVSGEGCVYPSSTQTLPGELSAHHLTWRAYVQGTDEPGATAGACAHPAAGQADPSADQSASSGQFATFRDPFVYFHAITDAPSCATDVVGLSALARDLRRGNAAPSFSYVVPDRCHDGNPTPCTPGAAAGMGPADSFLSTVVPQIRRSRAYSHGGLIVITSDEAPSSGEYSDSGSCCGQPATYPDIPAGTSPFSGPGGGTVGALLISPYVKGGTTSQEQLNHFSLLRTLADLFHVPHPGYSALAGVKGLEPALFTAKPSS
jgi:hypothetical protein